MNAGTVITDAEHTLKPFDIGFGVIPILLYLCLYQVKVAQGIQDTVIINGSGCIVGHFL